MKGAITQETTRQDDMMYHAKAAEEFLNGIIGDVGSRDIIDYPKNERTYRGVIEDLLRLQGHIGQLVKLIGSD